MNIEFEITLRCNATCPSCSRHTPLYSEESDITWEQVYDFAQEIKEHGDIDLVSIMGGEPTLHPRFEHIVELMYKLYELGHIKRLQIITNGIIPVSEKISGSVAVVISRQEDKGHKHRCQLVAPCDTGQELKEGECEIPRVCGIAFNAYGYFSCGAGGAIARLFKLSVDKYVRYTLPQNASVFGDLQDLCKLCQVKAKTQMKYKDYGDIVSVSFSHALHKATIQSLRKY